MPAKQLAQNGDVFETKLPDGRFGAIRVIKADAKSCLIAVTRYISEEPSTIADSRLGEILIKKSFNWKNEPALTGYSNAKLKILRYVGNLPLTQDEEKMKLWFGVGGFPFGSWGEWVGQEVYREWRWDHDKVAFQAEEETKRVEREKTLRIQPKPGKMMGDEEFWKLISLLDWSKTGNDNAVLEPLVAAMALLKKREICQFEENLSYKLFRLDTRDHAQHAFSSEADGPNGYLSPDGFLYARCVVVANGQEYYDTVASDPTQMPKDMEFEALLSISSMAFSRKSGTDDFEFVPNCSYETYSNLEGWR